MDNLEEMDKFFRRYNIPRLNQEKIENMNSMSWQLRWRTSAAERSYPGPEGRGGGQEELTRSRGKEQWLRFAGAAVKRDCMSKVRETQVRW